MLRFNITIAFIILLLLFSLCCHCNDAAMFTLMMHQCFSDLVRKWPTAAVGIPSSAAERWPEKGTFEYYAELANRNHFLCGRNLSRWMLDLPSLMAAPYSASSPSDWLIIKYPSLRDNSSFHLDIVVFRTNSTYAFALNFTVFLLVGKTSALTMNVVGVVKDWLLIAFS